MAQSLDACVRKRDKMNRTITGKYFLLIILAISATVGFAQERDGTGGAKLSVRQIMVGDQARLFLEADHNPAKSKLVWPAIPDTFNSLEVVERGKIDTTKVGDLVTYKQRIVLTGFDSGVFKIPAFAFAIVPNNGDSAYAVYSDSFDLLVNSVAVDTTQAFKPIKGIIYVTSTWRDYIWYIAGGAVLLIIAVVVTVLLLRRKKPEAPKPTGPVESLQDHALRMLRELEAKQLWEKKQVKEYYVELTDIVRNYMEQRYNIQVLEATTDEILSTAQTHPELYLHYPALSVILQTADLAKFAKAQPLPHEHMDAMVKAREFVETSRPVIISAPADGSGQAINETKQGAQ